MRLTYDEIPLGPNLWATAEIEIEVRNIDGEEDWFVGSVSYYLTDDQGNDVETSDDRATIDQIRDYVYRDPDPVLYRLDSRNADD